MADTRAIWADAIEPGIHTFAVDAFNRHPLEIANVFNIFSTERAYEDFKDAWSFGKMVKTAEGAPSYQQDFQEGYKTRLIPEDYSLESVVTHRLKADDLYGVFKNVGGEFGKAAAETANDEGFSVFRNALIESAFKTISNFGKALRRVTLRKAICHRQRLNEMDANLVYVIVRPLAII